jgi:RimJ/RimL family protein N-acetyltransferase
VSPAGRVRLRDGSSVQIRQIEPEDREALRAGFERLSDRTRYLRFQAPLPSLSEHQLAYLTDVDHHNHEALVAVDPKSDDGVGVARFVRVGDDVAECAIVVADDWQGRGLGTILLDRLAERAREEDITRFTALVLAENNDALRLLERLGETEKRSLGPQVELDIALPEADGAGVPLHALLRGAASGVLEPVISMWRVVADFAYQREPAPHEHVNAFVVHVQEREPDRGAVLRVAAGLAKPRSAHVHLVGSYYPVLENREQLQQQLDEAERELQSDGVQTTTHLHGGDPVDAIIDVAQEQRASLIVIEPSASGVLMPWRLQSLPDRVCARAPCEVLVAR